MLPCLSSYILPVRGNFQTADTGKPHILHIIMFFLLHFKSRCDIKRGSLNASMGKIASFHLSERDGHRLKAVPGCVAWFAPEQLWRHRRTPAVTGYECVPPWGANAGGTAEGMPFVPISGMRGFFVALTQPVKTHLKG